MKLKERIHHFLHDQKLKHKLYVIIFESDTPAGKLFDVILIWFILLSVLLVIIESLKGLPTYLATPFVIMEYIFTAFFTFEYITRIYCSPQPRKYIFSFFGIVDLLATLPLYMGLLFPGARYLLIIRAFRLIRIFRIFKLFKFLNEGELLLASLRESSKKIAVFFLFVVILVISIGTLMYMIEGTQPNSEFNNIPNSIYWAIVTMTTVGYGDITPVTGFGKFLSAIVMLIGYTIIAVPTGIVSVTMMKEYKRRMEKECPSCHRSGHEDNAKFCKYCGHNLEE
ncbi:ion transporter [Bacteroides faecalis]|uniref:Ion transporter n=1 Tax=Bacteroides faecalis TaxID=2447885 RepID=A0A401LUJ3_9BACE|nr:ion transporter [Bacteroides faecalis]GCB35238.1 ion transporter [Bacteroides faecalis]